MVEWLTLNGQTLSYIGTAFQIITNFFVIISVIFVGYQAWMYRRDYNERIRSSSVEKAANLSKFYADNIIFPYSQLFTYYQKIGVLDIINRIKLSDMSEFSNDELRKILSSGELAEYDQKFKNVDPSVIIITKFMHKSIDFTTYIELSSQCKDCNPEDSKIFNHHLINEFETEAVQLLNNLEYFAMNFNDDIANEETVYQSLHQTYLQVVKMSYIRIARLNKSKSDEYYTHIIELFTRWKSIYFEDQAKEFNQQLELERRISEFKKEQKDLTNIGIQKKRDKRRRTKNK